jgi:hypothetical protein
VQSRSFKCAGHASGWRATPKRSTATNYAVDGKIGTGVEHSNQILDEYQNAARRE